MIEPRRIVACCAAMMLAGNAPAGANPWFGTWSLRLKTAGEKPETLIYSDAGQGAMRMVSVEDGSVLVTRFDGRPAKISGGQAGGVRTLAIRATSPGSYDWTFAVAGTPYVRGINTLAADGRSFLETSWLVAKPGKLVTLTYRRR